MMANIATVFRWPPSEMYEMDIADLKRWHERAKARAPKRKGS